MKNERNSVYTPVPNTETFPLPDPVLPSATSRVNHYLQAIMKLAETRRPDIVSLLVFGSAPNGGFSEHVSDVDIMVVLADDVGQETKEAISRDIAALEQSYGLTEYSQGRFHHVFMICDQKIGGLKSLTVCYQRDLLTGRAAAVFDVPALLERLIMSTHIFCFASIFTSARTLWGEDLLPHIPIPVLTTHHLTKNFIMHLLRNACACGGYFFLPNGTKYAMAILKGFIHDCYSMYTAKAAPLEEKIDFFYRKTGKSQVFGQLLCLRKSYTSSPLFVLRCFGMLVRLYLVTLRDQRIPRFAPTELDVPNP